MLTLIHQPDVKYEHSVEGRSGADCCGTCPRPAASRRRCAQAARGEITVPRDRAPYPEDCLKVLDETELKNQKLLGKFDWGCMAGDHTGYANIEGKDEAAVKEMLRASMQNARPVKLNKFTAAEIKSFHEHMKS